MDQIAHSLDILKQFDRDRYFASLLLPASYRDDVIALYAFNAEIARVRDVVSEPIPGEIRLQWWRDSISDGGAEARANPVADHLLSVIERHDLSKEAFDKILLARAFDLYDDLMPTMTDFEVYAGETTSLLFRQAALIARAQSSSLLADCCGHAGVAYCVALVVRDFAKHASQGRILIPRQVLEKNGVNQERLLNGQYHEALQETLLEMVEKGRNHKRQALEAIKALPEEVQPVFNLLALVEPYLRQVEKRRFDPFEKGVTLSQLKRQWVLWRW